MYSGEELLKMEIVEKARGDGGLRSNSVVEYMA